MPIRLLSRIIQAVFPSVRTSVEEVGKTRQEAQQATFHFVEAKQANLEELRRRVIETSKERRQKNAERDAERFDRHVKLYDLDGIGIRRTGENDRSKGEPLTIEKLASAVRDRREVASTLGRDPGIKRGEVADVTALTAGLSPQDLRGLLDHADPGRQRNAADRIREARMRFQPEPDLARYATAVAEAAATEQLAMRDGQRPWDRIVDMVCARAILLRAGDYRWHRRDGNALLPLCGLPLRKR